MAVKVFCSHRSVDKPEVEAFATLLRKKGIDAWFDRWEIAPGDDIVARMNEGLEHNQVGLVFFSSKEHEGKWFWAEVATLTLSMIEEGKRLIPVMIDPAAPLPPLLRPRARRGIVEIDAIVDAILGISRKPALGEPPAAGALRRFLLHIRESDPGPRSGRSIDVVASLDGEERARATGLTLPPTVTVNFAEFLHGGFSTIYRDSPDATGPRLDEALERLGQDLGRVLFADPIAAALTSALNSLPIGGELELCFSAASPTLLGLPFEAARLPDGRAPVLLPAVVPLRRVDGAAPVEQTVSAGPLKILVAVGAPDESKTRNSVLDLEHELQGILDALETAIEHGNAEVRILEVGHPQQIAAALKRDPYHVLHLSCHGSPGLIELEDEDGNPVPIDAARLADTLRSAGRPLPLVFLATCHGGSPAGETVSFAQALIHAGIPQVLAMQTRVTDRYASELAAAFYGELNTPDRPTAGRALAHARRTLEERRQREARPAAPEYATASLFSAGPESPLLDRSRDQLPLSRTPIHETDEVGLPHLNIGDLIGRRPELRQSLAILRDHPRAIERYGKRVGVVLQGMGGVGKSALAGRIMARLREDGWTCIALAGAFNIDTLARRLGLSEGDDRQRIDAICRRLWTEKLLLVLDDFEKNLHVGGGHYTDPMVGEWLETLCQSCHHGRLLITSRHRPPDSESWLETLALPPLSPAEARKLIIRLPQLSSRGNDDLRAILQRIGGHPRMLEYLDAVLRRGASRLPEIRHRLNRQAKAAGVALTSPPATLDEAIARSLQLGAQDILLSELISLLTPTDRDILYQAAVSNLPIDSGGVARALHDRTADAKEQAGVLASLTTLADLSLLSFVGEGTVFVHRWTAECLLSPRSGLDEVERRDIHARAGRYRLWRAANASHDVADGMEAVRNFLKADAFDEATSLALDIVQALTHADQLAAAGGFAGELAEHTPPAHPNRAPLVDMEAESLIDLGFTNRGLACYRRLVADFEARCQAEPQRADYQRDLSVSYNKLGDLMTALGNGDDAQRYFQQALNIAEKLARAEPQRADYQRDLSVSYERLGDLMTALGNGDDAQRYFQQALNIRTNLARAEPQRADYQRDLVISLMRMADVDAQRTETYLEQGLSILEALKRSGRQVAQRDEMMAWLEGRLAEVRAGRGA